MIWLYSAAVAVVSWLWFVLRTPAWYSRLQDSLTKIIKKDDKLYTIDIKTKKKLETTYTKLTEELNLQIIPIDLKLQEIFDAFNMKYYIPLFDNSKISVKSFLLDYEKYFNLDEYLDFVYFKIETDETVKLDDFYLTLEGISCEYIYVDGNIWKKPSDFPQSLELDLSIRRGTEPLKCKSKIDEGGRDLVITCENGKFCSVEELKKFFSEFQPWFFLDQLEFSDIVVSFDIYLWDGKFKCGEVSLKKDQVFQYHNSNYNLVTGKISHDKLTIHAESSDNSNIYLIEGPSLKSAVYVDYPINLYDSCLPDEFWTRIKEFDIIENPIFKYLEKSSNFTIYYHNDGKMSCKIIQVTIRINKNLELKILQPNSNDIHSVKLVHNTKHRFTMDFEYDPINKLYFGKSPMCRFQYKYITNTFDQNSDFLDDAFTVTEGALSNDSNFITIFGVTNQNQKVIAYLPLHKRDVPQLFINDIYNSIITQNQQIWKHLAPTNLPDVHFHWIST